MNKFLITSIFLITNITYAGIRTIELPPEQSSSIAMKCGDYIYFGEKRSSYDVCMITGLLKTYEKGQCITHDEYKLLNKACSTKPDNVPQAYKMRDSSYYVEYSPETDGFVPMSSEN